MKRLAKLIVAGVIVYAGYVVLSDWLHRAEPEPEVVEEPEPPRSRREQITCPTCEGEGRLSYLDRRGHNHTYACRICNVTGRHIITLNAGTHICPDCKGMGRSEIRERQRDAQEGYIISATRCQRCNATGVILPRTQPGSSRPTPSR